MQKYFKANWFFLSIGLLSIVLLFIFLFLNAIQMIIWGIIIINICLVTIITVQKQLHVKQKGEFNSIGLIRNTILAIMGILFSLILSIVISGSATILIFTAIGDYFPLTSQGSFFSYGMLSGIIIGIFTGIFTGFLTRWIWSKIGRFVSKKNYLPAIRR